MAFKKTGASPMNMETGFDTGRLRTALGRFATGIAIVTTHCRQLGKLGVTVNSFSSVSLDPPLILWSLRKESKVLGVFRRCDAFAINVLGSGQKELSDHFAGHSEDKFASIAHSPGRGESPLLEDSIACFECVPHEFVDAGDHVIILGKIVSFHDRPGAPLIFSNGDYHSVPDKAMEQTLTKPSSRS